MKIHPSVRAMLRRTATTVFALTLMGAASLPHATAAEVEYSYTLNNVTTTWPSGAIRPSYRAEGNTIEIEGVQKPSTDIDGVLSYSASQPASNNTIIISKNSSVDQVRGGVNSSGTAENNQVKVTGSTINGDLVGAKGGGTGFTNKNTLDLTNSTVSGKVYAGWNSDGKVHSITDNTIVATGSTLKNDIYGGYSQSSQAGVVVSGNRVELTKTSHSNYIYGGSIGDPGEVSDNHIVVKEGTSTNSGYLYGGYSSGGGTIADNTVTLQDGTSGKYLYGGRSSNSSKTAVVKGNAVTIRNSTFATPESLTVHSDPKIFGGNIDATNSTGKTSQALGNSVTIDGSIVYASIYGAYTKGLSEVSGNSVTLVGSTVSCGDGGIYGAYNEHSGDVTGNFVTIDCSTVTGKVYGAYASGGVSTGNTVMLKNKCDLSAATIYGSNSSSATNGNTLVLNNFNGKLGTVANFDSIYTTDGTTNTDGTMRIGSATTTINGGTLTANSMNFIGETSISNATLKATDGDINFSGTSLTLSNSTLIVTGGENKIYVDAATQLNLGSDVVFNGTFVYEPTGGGEGGEGGTSGGSIGLGVPGDDLYTLENDDMFSDYSGTLRVNAETLILANSGLNEDSTLTTTQASGSIIVEASEDNTSTPVQYTLGSLNTNSAKVEGEETGIVLATNKQAAGDTTTYAGSVTMNAATTQRIDMSLEPLADDSTSSKLVTDIVVVRDLDAQGATILLANPEEAATLALLEPVETVSLDRNDFIGDDQMEVKVVRVEGKVISGYSEDAGYATLPNEQGFEQRTLQHMNAWVDTRDDGAYVVFSRNYRSAEGMTANQQGVSRTLQQFSPLYSQAAGERAASDSRFVNMLDAFDFTRSGAAALNGLTSVSGVTTTIAQHAAMDSSRHHLDALRQWIALPSCPAVKDAAAPVVVAADGKASASVASAPATVEPAASAWATYLGGYDMIDDPASDMGGYTRSYHGALVGYNRSVSCNLLLGVGLGYENSVSRSDSTRHDDDSFFFDLYGSARTGRFYHRFSLGVGMHSFDARRGVYVAAPGHDFAGTGAADFRARSLNLGYELGTDVELGNRSVLSPFIALNYAHHSFDNVEETGLGDASLLTELESIDQLEAALGARYTHDFEMLKDQAPATFFASAEIKAEFSENTPTACSRFAAHPEAAFRTESLERSPFYGEIGAGLKVPFATQWTGSLSAGYEFGRDRNAVNVGAGVNYRF